jgi:DNA modification methylase
VSVQILMGDCRAVLQTLPAESVHCVVTSPPYWGLRDYGTAKWEGGDAGCDHAMPVSYKSSTLGASTGGRSEETHKRSIDAQATPYRNKCAKCGATRIDSQLGLEQTPAEYVERMVEVFREVRRVLRKDGTIWLNLGDSYAANQTNNGGCSPKSTLGGGGGKYRDGSKNEAAFNGGISRRVNHGIKAKDLVGIPWMVAFALRADGWWLRQDIIWAKPNPMPESVTDRCTKSHEYIFLLSKSATYYYNAEAIAEPATFAGEQLGIVRGTKRRADSMNVEPSGNEKPGADADIGATRNKRSVWTVTTQPFAEAHFATFPPALIEPCILAGCPKDGTVLDPFGGAGTTGLVADRQQRNAILIELNPAYAAMAKNRIYNDAPLFAEVT